MFRRSVWLFLLSLGFVGHFGCQAPSTPETPQPPAVPERASPPESANTPEQPADTSPIPLAAADPSAPSAEPNTQPPPSPQPPKKTPAAAPPGWTATATSVPVAGFEVCEDISNPATCRAVVASEALAAGVTLRTDATSQALITLSDGGTVRLDTNTTLTLDASTARAASLTQGRALFDLPENTTPHARLHLPAGEVLFLGTEVLVDISPGAQWVTVLRGAVSAGGLTAGAGEGFKWTTGETPTRVPSVDPAGEADWAEPRDAAVGVIPRGLGSLFAQTPGGGTPKPLKAVERRVQVRIQGWMSYTEITEIFENTSGDTLEGVYRFPLPADAQISRLALKVGGEWQEGVFVENRRAERIWDQVISDWRDPAWLRWKQGEQFELKIFPIDGHSKREVKIGYTQPLKLAGDTQVYSYLMPADPGSAQPVGQFSFSATVEGHDVEGGVSVRGYEATITPGDTTKQTKITYEAKDFAASGDLRLQLRAPQLLSPLQAAAFTDTRDPKKPFHTAALTLNPEWPVIQDSLAPGHDIVLVADVSFSRAGEALAVQAATMARIIELMDGADRVQVIACATRCEPVGPRTWTRPDKTFAAKIREDLSKIPASGTTNLLEGPRVAAALFESRDDKSKARGARIIMLTDGEASSGVQAPAEVRAALTKVLSPLGDARLTPVDLGGGGDPLMLRAMALGGSGKLITLDPSEALGTASRRILAAQGDRLMTDISVTLPPGFADVYPTEPLPLAAGEHLRLYGRLTSGEASGEVMIKGRIAGQLVEQRVPITLKAQPDKTISYIPRLWAQSRIESLELEDSERHREEIVALSLDQGLMSRHTSLMALENDAMRREFGLQRNANNSWTGEGDDPKTKANAQPDSPTETGTTTRPPPLSPKPSLSPDKRPSDSKGEAGGGRASDSGSANTGSSGLGKSGGQFGPAPASAPKDKESDFSPRSDDGYNHDPAPSSAKESSKKDAASPAKISPSGGISIDDLDGGGSIGPNRYHHKPYRNPSFAREPKAVDFGKRITQAQADVDKRVGDPQPLKKLIRLLGLAGRDAEAAALVDAWRTRNPRDVEALLLAAEVALRAGRPDDALRLVTDAAEVGARAQWLQTRLLHTYEASAQPVLACHQNLSVQSLLPKKPKGAPSLDALSCPVASDLSWIGASAVAASSSVSLPVPAAPKSVGMRISLTWEGSEDVTLALVGSDGRVVSWLGGHDAVYVDHAVGAGYETLALKDPRDGLYTVEVFRSASAASSAPTRGTLTVEMPDASVKKTFAWTLSGTRATIADLKFSEW